MHRSVMMYLYLPKMTISEVEGWARRPDHSVEVFRSPSLCSQIVMYERETPFRRDQILEEIRFQPKTLGFAVGRFYRAVNSKSSLESSSMILGR
jgi:hypothetical protein